MITYALPPNLERIDADYEWYTHKGERIRSVGKILDRLFPMPPDLDPWYLERGKMVHLATTIIDAGTLDWNTLDPRIKPFCDAYQSFLDTSKVIVEASELTVVHPSYKYGARLDRIYSFPGGGKPVVVDIKTGTGKKDRYWLQVAGCAMAFNEAEAPLFDLALLNLDNKGNPHLTFADDPGTWLERWRKVLSDDVA